MDKFKIICTNCDQCCEVEDYISTGIQGNSKIEINHDIEIEGNEPLRVRWLCRSCHVKWDKAEPKGVTYII